MSRNISLQKVVKSGLELSANVLGSIGNANNKQGWLAGSDALRAASAAVDLYGDLEEITREWLVPRNLTELSKTMKAFDERLRHNLTGTWTDHGSGAIDFLSHDEQKEQLLYLSASGSVYRGGVYASGYSPQFLVSGYNTRRNRILIVGQSELNNVRSQIIRAHTFVLDPRQDVITQVEFYELHRP